VIGLLSWALLPSTAALGTIGLFVVLIVAGFIHPPIAILFYRAWNRMGRLASGAMTWWVTVLLRLLFHLARAPSPHGTTEGGNGGTAWSQLEVTRSGRTEKHLSEERSAWLDHARRSHTAGKEWWIALLPLVWLLSFTGAGARNRPVPQDTYTLY